MIHNDDMTKIEVVVRDPDDQLVKLIEYIKRNAGPGHSFEVIVDPNDSENKKSFFIDGDGPFFIEIIRKNSTVYTNIEEYLRKIQ